MYIVPNISFLKVVALCIGKNIFLACSDHFLVFHILISFENELKDLLLFAPFYFYLGVAHILRR